MCSPDWWGGESGGMTTLVAGVLWPPWVGSFVLCREELGLNERTHVLAPTLPPPSCMPRDLPPTLSGPQFSITRLSGGSNEMQVVKAIRKL